MTTDPNPNAITKYESDAIVPRSFAEAEAFATALSKSQIIPEKLRQRAPDVLVIVLAGRELGLAPLAALRTFHVIEGTPRLSADGLTAVVMASSVCKYLRVIESSDTACTWETLRVGHETPTRKTWTKEMAVRAQLWDRNNRDGSPGMWKKYPHRMLSARAKAELCRDVYPELAAGLVTMEEIDDNDTPIGPPTFTAPPAPVAPPAAGEPPKRGPGRPPKAKPEPASPTASTPTTAAPPPHAEDAEDAEIVDETPAGAKDAAPPADPTPPAAADAGAAAYAAAYADKPSSNGAPASTSTGGASSSSGDGFGDEPAARTMAGFKSAVEKAGSVATLDAVKADWIEWSKVEGPGGGKQHAPEMRATFAARLKEIEAATGAGR